MNLPAFIDACERELRPTFAAVAADEGTLWLLDEAGGALVPAWNSGPKASVMVGAENFRQPLTAGLISLACVTEQALCENDVYQNTQQDPTLDQRLGVLTCAMIAVPFREKGEIKGVVSCVRLKARADAPNPPPFTLHDVAQVTAATEALSPA